MPRVAFYTRISLDEDKQKFSLEAQKERLEAFCTSQYGKDWSLFRLYRETASGTTMQRPELQRMLAEAKAGLFDVVVVYRVDRFSRRVHELSMLAMELKSYGVDFKSASEPIETDSPSGMMILQTLGVFAEFEQKSIVERTKAGMKKKAETGAWPGGTIPLGYRIDAEKKLHVVEDQAAIVRKMFTMYIEGREGSGTIAQRLNKVGYRTARGRRFGRKAVLHVLRNPFYVGRFRWQQLEYAGHHEAIVSDETFAAAQEILQSRSEESPGKHWHNQSERLLTGLLRCGHCRSSLIGVSGNKKGQKHAYYACRKRLETQECDLDYVRADWIEKEILDEIQRVFRDEALLEEIWQAAQAQLAASVPQLEVEIKHVDRERAKAQGALDRYLKAFEAGTMDSAACSPRVTELAAQIKQLDDQRAALQEQRTALDLPAMRADFLNEILNNLSGVVGAIPAPQKKHLLRLLVEKVIVRDRRTVEVWYRLPQFQGVRTQSEVVAPTGLEPVLPP